MRTPLLIASAALTAALLAGCGGNDPAPSPSPTPSPTAGATGRVAPPLPQAATVHTKAGAIAFVRHYVDLINYAQATGDTTQLHAAGSAGCSACRAVERNINRIYRSNGTFDGGVTVIARVIDALTYPITHGYTVDLAVRIEPSTVTTNGKANHSKGGRNLLSVIVQPSANAWEVREWTRAM